MTYSEMQSWFAGEVEKARYRFPLAKPDKIFMSRMDFFELQKDAPIFNTTSRTHPGRKEFMDVPVFLVLDDNILEMTFKIE